MGIMSAESMIVFWMTLNNTSFTPLVINKWAVMCVAILALLGCLFSLANSLFSVYLRCKGFTRIDYRFRETDSNNSDYSDSDNMESN